MFQSPYRVVFQFSLMQVDDVGAHTVQEVLRMGYEYKDSLEPDNNKWHQLNVSIVWSRIKNKQ